MSKTSLLLGFLFLAGACGGAEEKPNTASTTEATAPDEKSEDDIKMSAGNPAAPAKKEAAPAAGSKPAAGESKPAQPATAPK